MIPTFHLFVPEGSPALGSLRTRLQAEPTVLRHPKHREDAFVVCANEGTAERTELALRGDQALSNQALIILRSQSVTVHQLVDAQVLAKVATLLQELWPDVERIVDEHGHDVSGRFLDAPGLLFR